MVNITFIIPNRGGEHIDFVIQQIKKYYPNEDYIVITQDDNEPFKRGQLFNIAYKYVNTEYICLTDNDIFFPNDPKLIEEYNKCNAKILQPFEYIERGNLINDEYVKVRDIHMNYCNNLGSNDIPDSGVACGGVTFMSCKVFEECNGFSNLYLSWGREDNEFYMRSGKSFYSPENSHISHIDHPTRSNDNKKNVDINWNLSFYRDNRNYKLDGYKDTIYNITKDETINNVRWIYVNNIYVKPDFLYKNELDKHYKYIKYKPTITHITSEIKEQVIITLTTFKDRLAIVPQTLNSLLNGTVQPDKYVINLSTDEFPNKEGDISTLAQFCEKNNIEINWVKENTKPYKKLIPTLKRFPNDIIISVDDDIDYPKNFVETLLNDWNNSDKTSPITAGNYIWMNKIWTHHGSFTLCKAEHFGNYIFDLYENFALKHLDDLGLIDDQMITYAALLNDVFYKPSSKLLEPYKQSHTYVNARKSSAITKGNIGRTIQKYDVAIRQYIWDKYQVDTNEIINNQPIIQNKETMYGTAGMGGINKSERRAAITKLAYNQQPKQTKQVQTIRNEMTNILNGIQRSRLARKY